MSSDEPATDLPVGLSPSARLALGAAGYHRLADLDGVPEAELRQLPGVGPKALRLLKLALSGRGMGLAG
ncbi:DNA-binding protein [Streptacidiphilus sp. MAP12-20]|uniref:DNA-binding protein n=1 Tax=Streptacidiphilus sp. MAP12-20 TaxID=3156299 RepID=UPI003512BF4A